MIKRKAQMATFLNAIILWRLLALRMVFGGIWNEFTDCESSKILLANVDCREFL